VNYASKADMLAMFGNAEITQITDRANIGVVDDATLQIALDDATSEADSYLPVAPVTPSRALVRHTAAIARFFLYANKATDEVRERYDDAIAWLKLASHGTIEYGSLPASLTAPAGIPQSQSLKLSHEKYRVQRVGGFVI